MNTYGPRHFRSISQHFAAFATITLQPPATLNSTGHFGEADVLLARFQAGSIANNLNTIVTLPFSFQ